MRVHRLLDAAAPESSCHFDGWMDIIRSGQHAQYSQPRAKVDTVTAAAHRLRNDPLATVHVGRASSSSPTSSASSGDSPRCGYESGSEGSVPRRSRSFGGSLLYQIPENSIDSLTAPLASVTFENEQGVLTKAHYASPRARLPARRTEPESPSNSSSSSDSAGSASTPLARKNRKTHSGDTAPLARGSARAEARQRRDVEELSPALGSLRVRTQAPPTPMNTTPSPQGRSSSNSPEKRPAGYPRRARF